MMPRCGWPHRMCPIMSAERPTIRRHHDFRRVTDVTRTTGLDGDTLYRMKSDTLDRLVAAIRIPTNDDQLSFS